VMLQAAYVCAGLLWRKVFVVPRHLACTTISKLVECTSGRNDCQSDQQPPRLALAFERSQELRQLHCRPHPAQG
jgi:hypothetical protein